MTALLCFMLAPLFKRFDPNKKAPCGEGADDKTCADEKPKPKHPPH